MKPDETQWHAKDIATQPGLRRMQGMHTDASNSPATNAMSTRIRFIRTPIDTEVAT